MKERRQGWQDGSTVIVKWDEKTRYKKILFRNRNGRRMYFRTGKDTMVKYSDRIYCEVTVSLTIYIANIR